MKVVLVTGASSGIGLGTAKILAREGWTVVLLCRDAQRGEQARAEVAAQSTGGQPQLLLADLASLNAVVEVAAEFKRRFPSLDVLINNAGINPTQRTVTVDGIESNFAVNHLAPFLLTNLLIDPLVANAHARVVTVASSVEKVMRTNLNLDDLQSSADWDAMKAYGRSKQANILFTIELSRRLSGSGVTANCLHPGIVGTNIFRDAPPFMQWLGKRLLPSSDKGARTSVYLASSQEVEGLTGKFFKGEKAVLPSAAASDLERARRLWVESTQMIQAKLPNLELPSLM